MIAAWELAEPLKVGLGGFPRARSEPLALLPAALIGAIARIHLIVPGEKESVADVLRFFEPAPILTEVLPRETLRRDTRQDSGLRSQVAKEAEKAGHEIQLQPCQRIVNFQIHYLPATNDARPKP